MPFAEFRAPIAALSVPIPRPRHWVALVAFFSAVLPVAGRAQDPDRRDLVDWRLVAEATGVFGGTWLEGPRIPTVASTTGFTLGLGGQRGWTDHVAAGGGLRFGLQSLDIKENGTSWSGGTVTEIDALATVSIQSRRRTSLRLSLDVSGGAALLSGANKILPFTDASSLAPLAEIGVAVRRGARDEDASRRDIALLVRYGALRLNTEVVNVVTTPGWVGRFMVGIRMTR